MSAKQDSPLLKKHSQSDLVSRLKSRRILGVGVKDADGEFHRSKISQMLGNEFKFDFHEPFGLRHWQFISALAFSAIGILALAFPRTLHGWLFQEEHSRSCAMNLRFHGGALLSISLILWHAVYTTEKAVVRWALLAQTCYFAVGFLVVLITSVDQDAIPQDAAVLLSGFGLFGIFSLFYYIQVGRKPKKI
ncbi:tumor protein p53-inducible protein 11-like [Mobula birostris]|uniref:tumor protein p53-inducible protein 11-like n=1 Tax=Mobula birostris TaxID=1983395 RepID=UPI003B286585